MWVEKKIGKFKMRILPNGGGIHGNLLKIAKKGGEREPELLHLLRNEIKKGNTCIDLGANIGYITLLMSDVVGPTGKIFAIEPDPNNIKLLRMNIGLNGFKDRVRMYDIGISNKNDTVDFHFGKASNLGGMERTSNTIKKSIKVKVRTLSDFCKNNLPNLVKMDIEGHEVEVLEGMYDLVKTKKFPCKIVMELHPTAYTKVHSLEKWMRKFLECGFKTKYVISAGVPIPDLFKEWGYKPKKVFGGRALYDDFSDEHMLKACCHQVKQWVPGKNRYSPKVSRFVMIERK